MILRCFPEIRDKDRRVCMYRESTVAGVHAQGIRTLALHEENPTCIFNRKGSAKFRLIVCENVFPKQVGVTILTPKRKHFHTKLIITSGCM